MKLLKSGEFLVRDGIVAQPVTVAVAIGRNAGALAYTGAGEYHDAGVAANEAQQGIPRRTDRGFHKHMIRFPDA